MGEEVQVIYQNILQQVMTIETCKKELSTEILVTRNQSRRIKMINNFLNYDLSKHELLEHAAVVAMNNQENSVLEHLDRLYAHGDLAEEPLERIRKEIKFIQRFMDLLTKNQSAPDSLSFVERRMLQEITKYVMEQARQYQRVES